MKKRNLLIVSILVLLLLQLPFRRNVGETYPMVVLPKGENVHHMNDEKILLQNWQAIGLSQGGDSVEIPANMLFPGSPKQYHSNMYSSLAQAAQSPHETDQAKAARWIRERLEDRQQASQIDSVCVHRVVKEYRLSGEETIIDVVSTACQRL